MLLWTSAQELAQQEAGSGLFLDVVTAACAGEGALSVVKSIKLLVAIDYSTVVFSSDKS